MQPTLAEETGRPKKTPNTTPRDCCPFGLFGGLVSFVLKRPHNLLSVVECGIFLSLLLFSLWGWDWIVAAAAVAAEAAARNNATIPCTVVPLMTDLGDDGSEDVIFHCILLSGPDAI